MAADLLNLADLVVTWGGDDEQVEAVAWRAVKTMIRADVGRVESLSSAQVQGVGIRVVMGAPSGSWGSGLGRDRRVRARQGFAYTTSLTEGALRATLAEARDNLAFATPDEHVGLAVPDGVPAAALGRLYRPEQQTVTTRAKIKMALELERAVRATDPRVFGVESAEYSDAVGEHCVVTSTGIRASNQETACYVVARALAAERGQTQTGFGFSLGRHIDDLDVAAAASDAARGATRRLGATAAPAGRATLVLDPYVIAHLISAVGAALTGDAVQRGRSLFAGRLGEAVASPLVTLVDDPTDPLAYTATRTDGEGLATRRNELIRAGVLERFVHNSSTGRRAGLASTGSAVRSGFASTPTVACMALALAPGAGTQADLIADAGDAVLITDVGGLHWGVNTATGQLCIAAEGHRIASGEIAEPFRPFTVNTTVQTLLRNVVAVGADVRVIPTNATGVTVAVADIAVSGAEPEHDVNEAP